MSDTTDNNKYSILAFNQSDVDLLKGSLRTHIKSLNSTKEKYVEAKNETMIELLELDLSEANSLLLVLEEAKFVHEM